MTSGNNSAGTRKKETLFIAQKTYFSPLIGAGGNKYNLLMSQPHGFDSENDPAQNVDSTVANTAGAVRALIHDIVWVYPFQDVKRILNQAVCTMTVEMAAGGIIDDVSVWVGKYNVATGVFTATGTQTYQTQPGAGAAGLALAGAASRKINIIVNDMTPMAIAVGERPAFRTTVYAHRTGGVEVPVTIFHQRGMLDTYMVCDALKEDY